MYEVLHHMYPPDALLPQSVLLRNAADMVLYHYNVIKF